MTADIIDFSSRKHRAETAEWERMARLRAREKIIRARLSERTRLSKADRAILARNLGRLMEQAWEDPKRHCPEVFRRAKNGNVDATESALKKRKNWIRFDKEETSGGPLAADRRDFLALADAIGALASKPSHEVVYELVRRSSLAEQSAWSGETDDAAIGEVERRLAAVMRRLRSETEIDWYLRHLSQEIIQLSDETGELERREDLDGFPHPDFVFSGQMGAAGYFCEVADALPKTPLAVIFSGRLVHFASLSAQDKKSLSGARDENLIAEIFARGGYSERLNAAAAEYPAGSTLMFDANDLHLTITPSREGGYLQFSIFEGGGAYCAEPSLATALRMQHLNDDEGTCFVATDDGAVLGFLRSPKADSNIASDWIEGLWGPYELTAVDNDLLQNLFLRPAALWRPNLLRLPNDWLMIEAQFPHEGGLTSCVPAHTLAGAMLRNLAFADDHNRLDVRLASSINESVKQLQQREADDEATYLKAMRNRFGNAIHKEARD